MLFVVRHGERADQVGLLKEVEIDGDTHITTHGRLQAQETGRYIRKQVDEYQEGSKLVSESSREPMTAVILSSPWLRCIQTASGIHETVGPVYKEAIHVEDSLGEYVEWKSYEEKHKKLLFLFTRTEDERKRYFNSPVEESFIADEEFNAHKSFRGYVGMNKRIALVNDYCRKLMRGYEFPSSRFYFVLVTHGCVLESLLYYLEVTMTPQIDFCSIIVSVEEVDKNGQRFIKLINDGSNSHVKGLKREL